MNQDPQERSDEAGLPAAPSVPGALFRGAKAMDADWVLSRLLMAGLVLAVLILVAGVGLAIAGVGDEVTRGSSLSALPRALAAGEPWGFFILGLLVLVATPVARVLFLLVWFARRGSWWFFGVSAIVLVVISLSVVLGLRA